MIRRFAPISLLTIISILLPVLLEDEPVPEHDSILTGQLRYEEIMRSRNENRFRNNCRMDRNTFTRLVDFLKQHGNLKDSEKVSAGEKLMTFITILKGYSNRDTNEIWQHSGSTISIIVKEMCQVFEEVQHLLFIKPSNQTPANIANNPKFIEFSDCIGALDGCHVSASTNNGTFRNRKGFMSQNILNGFFRISRMERQCTRRSSIS
jgi:hypothetical protein